MGTYRMSCLCDIAGAVTLDVLHPQYGCMRVGYTQLQDVARGIEAMARGGDGVYGWSAAMKEQWLVLDEH